MEKCLEVIKAYPLEQMLRHLVCRVIVGKRNKYHGYQRYDRKHKQSDHRQGKQSYVKLVIKKIINVFLEILRFLTDYMILLEHVALSSRVYIENDKENKKN